MLTRYFAGVFGSVYVVVAIVGFIPGISPGFSDTGDDYIVDTSLREIVGLFPVNIMHNVAHLLIGVAGLLAYRSVANARLYARGLTVLYAVLAVFGLLPGLKTVFGLIPLNGHDIWLHALSGVVTAYFGWFAPEEETSPLPQPRRA